MLEGELVVRVNEGEFPLRPGMCIGFKAGDPNGHHLVNRSQSERCSSSWAAACRATRGSTRTTTSRGFAPKRDGLRSHKDGTPYPESKTGA
jgi:uncharacterized cupin superfamily protein